VANRTAAQHDGAELRAEIGSLLLARAVEYIRGMDDGLTTPNCPACLTHLWAAGSDEKPYWWCPICKVARLT
jgi:hypothetical protein